MEREQTPRRVPIRELVRYYLRLGLLGFGGPVALVGQMEREMVGERKWLTKEEMREGIAVCQSLPGPLAIQVGIWISYIRGGFWGARRSARTRDAQSRCGKLRRRPSSAPATRPNTTPGITPGSSMDLRISVMLNTQIA